MLNQKGKMNHTILSLILLLLIQFSVKAQSIESKPITIGVQEIFHSKVLDEDRLIFIQTPDNYNQIDNVPVVIVLDAESQFNQTATTISYISNGAQGNDIIPPSIVIGITNSNRNRDFTPIQGMIGLDSTSINNTGGAPKFLSFITDELIPYIDTTYRTCSNRTLIGHSLGGLFVFHALLEKSDYFDNYVAIDPAIGFADGMYLDEILSNFKKMDLRSENMYYASAFNRPSGMTNEELLKTSHQFLYNIDRANLVFQKHKESEQWKINLRTAHYPDEDHYSVPLRATYDAMQYFHDYYQFEEMGELFFTASSNSVIDMVKKLKNHYSLISEKMGCEIKPQLGYLNSWAWGYGEDIRFRPTAHDMFMYGIDLYPDVPEAYSNYGYFLHRKGEYSEAIRQFDNALELETNDSILELKNEMLKEMTKHNKK